MSGDCVEFGQVWGLLKPGVDNLPLFLGCFVVSLTYYNTMLSLTQWGGCTQTQFTPVAHSLRPIVAAMVPLLFTTALKAVCLNFSLRVHAHIYHVPALAPHLQKW